MRISKISLSMIAIGLISSVALADWVVKGKVAMPAYPMDINSRSVENGGTMSAQEAYSDGVGTIVKGNIGSRVDNTAMNALVKKYGLIAAENGVSIDAQVLEGTNDSAPSAQDVTFAKIIRGNTNDSGFASEGTLCDDGDIQTINDAYSAGVCVGDNVEGEICNDLSEETINDVYVDGICIGEFRTGPCDDENVQTIEDAYNGNGVCVGVNVEGQACSDGDNLTENDVYKDGVCSGTPVPLSTCLETLQKGKSTGSGIYTIKPNGSEIDVYCDMETDGGGWLDVHKTFLLVDSSATMRNRIFLPTNLNEAPVSSASGFYLAYTGAGHGTGIYLDPNLMTNFTEVKMSWILQGNDDGYRCTSKNWIPLNGPGYNGGYTGYQAPTIAGKTNIQGTCTRGRDAPVSASYNSNINENTMLVWSGSSLSTDLTTGNCALSSSIPTNRVALWFSQLLLR